MNVILRNKESLTFDKLDWGTVFKVDGDNGLFMRVYNNVNNSDFNCVDIQTGCLYKTLPDQEVKLISGSFVEDKVN